MVRTRREAASFVIDSIRAMGINLHPQSRLMRMQRVLSDACKETGGVIQPNHPEFETALESVRDVQLLEFVFDQLESHCDDTEFQKLVKKAGSVLFSFVLIMHTVSQPRTPKYRANPTLDL